MKRSGSVKNVPTAKGGGCGGGGGGGTQRWGRNPENTLAKTSVVRVFP